MYGYIKFGTHAHFIYTSIFYPILKSIKKYVIKLLSHTKYPHVNYFNWLLSTGLLDGTEENNVYVSRLIFIRVVHNLNLLPQYQL